MIKMTQREFIAVRDEWYNKLKQEGFKDIENNHEENSYLHVWEKHYFTNVCKPEKIDENKSYYEAASDFLNSHPFTTDEEKTVWELHADGLSLRQTAKKLGKKICRIHKIIKKLKLSMLLKIK